MVRTTDSLVAGIVEVDTAIGLTPFISAASTLVDDIADFSTVNSTERLTIIETWLSAHFYCIRDPRSVREKAGSVEEVIESKVDLNLNVTRYGQMAMVLDKSGYLRSISDSRRRKVSATWMGTTLE